MKRVPVIVAALALASFATPATVRAQAPAPKVTITGLFDQITSAGKNFFDGDYTRTADHEWYARTRFRPDFTFEVGKVKAVLGLEIDLTYGQVRPVGGGPGKGGTAGANGGTNGDKFGVTSDLALNTDTAGVIEIKWIYTEFPLTGKDSVMPFIPVETTARLGGQPWGAIAQMREYALYAGGDFAGLATFTQVAPSFKLSFAYAQVEDELANYNKGIPIAATSPNYTSGAGSKLTRGNDWAIVLSPEYEAFKGLTLKAMYSFFRPDGTTSTVARRTAIDRFIVGNNTAGAAAYGAGTYLNGDPSMHENRNTFGFEAGWRSGPFAFLPALYYQFGNRAVQCNCNNDGAAFTTRRVQTDQAAWLIDLLGTYQLGPLLLETRAIYSTGNKAHDNLARSIRYFEPLDEDASYYTGWAMMLGGSPIDYFVGSGPNAGMITNVGYDRFGRAQLGLRATYSVTPAWTWWSMLSPTWTAEKVDTHTGVVAASGNSQFGQRVIIDDHSFVQGDSRYIGTEFDLGMTWRFAANAAFDLGGGWLFAGRALRTTEILNGVATLREQHDAYTAQARVRLSF
jgi:hypothetical protein